MTLNNYTNKMKKILYILLSFFFLVGCKDDSADLSVNADAFVFFSVTYKGEEIEATIDKANKNILIPTVEYGQLITGVNYQLEDGVTIYPLPETFLGEWDIEEKVQVSFPNGASTAYTIVLSDVNFQISVSPQAKEQEIMIMGTDIERTAGFLFEMKNSQEIIDWCFKDIPFNTCRVSYDKKQELSEGSQTMDFYDNHVKAMNMIKEANPEIKFWATMKSDYNGYGGANNLPDWICDNKPTTRFDTDKYADFLCDYLEYMHKQNLTISYLSTAKEWTQAVTVDRSIKIIEALKNKCETRKVPMPLITDPASWGLNQGASFVKSVASKKKEGLYYGFATHNYGKFYPYKNFTTETNKVGKPAFDDESTYGFIGDAIGDTEETMRMGIERYITKMDMYRAGYQGELFFEPFSGAVKDKTRAIYCVKGTDGVRRIGYYTMKEFALAAIDKYFSFTKHSLSDDNVSSIAFVNEDEVSIIVANLSKNEKKVSIALENTSDVYTSITQRSFNLDTPAEGVSPEVSLNNNKSEVVLPSLSLTFFTLKK
mgnify:FL=1